MGSTRTLKRLEAGVKVRLTFVVIGSLAEYYGAPRQTRFELQRIWRFVDEEIWAQPSHAVENSGWDAYLEFERLAVGIDKFETTLLPGLAQTERFMRMLFERSELSAQEIGRLIEDRLARQSEFEARLNASLSCRFLLAEAVLRNGCGDHEFSRLLEFDERENVTVKYLPFSGGPYPKLNVPFSVLSFRNTEEPSIIYLESPYERRFYENSEAVGTYHQIIEGGLRQAKSLKEFKR